MGQGTPEEVAEDALDAGLAAMEGEGLSEELAMGHQGAGGRWQLAFDSASTTRPVGVKWRLRGPVAPYGEWA